MTHKEKYNGNSVIGRGYEIYDEWIEKKHGSRKIVASAERTVRLFKNRKTMDAFIDALAYLFALDMRIKEKYNNILRCLFSYFSWRRETRALGFLKSELNIPLGTTDIRDAIEVELERLIENLENEWNEDGDDEAHGGKRNGKSEEDEVATEEKAQEQEPEEKAEEITDAKESSEEKAEDISEQATSDEPIKNEASQQKTEEAISEEVEIVANDEKDQVQEENQSELKEERNVPDDKSEPSTDKKEEAMAYNDAVDSPPIYEENTRDQSDNKPSFIDEVIMDNMVKGKEDFIWHNPVDDVKQNKEADHLQDTVAHQNEESKESDKDAYLYDKMLATDKGETQQTEKIESKQQTEKGPEVKSEEQNAFVQKNDRFEPVKPEAESFREPIQVDISHTQENEMRMELSSNMTSEAIEAIKEAQSAFMSEQLDILDAEHKANANAMREQLTIASEELDMNDTDKSARVSEPNAVSSPSVTQNRK